MDYVIRGRGIDPTGLKAFYNNHGRPGFYGLPFDFNLSHTAGFTACAIGGRVGVDCEIIEPVREAVRERVCTKQELSWLDSREDIDEGFMYLWTMKEAFVKMLGTGLSHGLSNVSTGGEGNIFKLYPKLKLTQKRMGAVILSAVELECGKINFYKVDLLS